MKIKQKETPPKLAMINSLLIDGESLLKQGFHGTKQVQNEFGSVGTIYHFIQTIKRFYADYFVTKIVVFWEGEDSKSYRQGFYKHYKTNRNNHYTEDQLYDLGRQRLRIKQYLEELFIRQVEVARCEADDSIAHYVVSSAGEQKIIYTADRDLLQLISAETKVYLSDKRLIITDKNFKEHFDYHRGNVGLIKIIAGDQSDNISGLMGIGEGTVLKFFPEIKTEKKTVEWVIERSKELLLDKPKSNQLQTIVEGKTKWGSMGVDYWAVMNTIINLENPHVTDEMKTTIEETVNNPLDPEGRGGVNSVMRMIAEDNIINLFPQNDTAYLNFWQPFMVIITKETNLFKKII